MQNDSLFDFPCSDTFRRYEDELLNRPSGDYRTLSQIRYDEDLASVRQAREEMRDHWDPDDPDEHRARHRELWKAIETLTDTLGKIQREQQCLNDRLHKLIDKMETRESISVKQQFKVSA